MLEEKIRFVNEYNDKPLEPYERLGMEIVRIAVLDYAKMKKKILKGRNVSANMKYNGLSAEAFLESKDSNFLSGIDMSINIKEAVDSTLQRNDNIDEAYERAREEYRNANKGKRGRPKTRK